MLIRLFQHNSICWGRVLVERPGKVCAAPYLLIRARLVPGPELAQEQNNAALIVGTCRSLATTLYRMGEVESRAPTCESWR